MDLQFIHESIKRLHVDMKDIAESINTSVKDQLREFENSQEKKIKTMMNEYSTRQEFFIREELKETKKNLKEELKQDITHKLQVINTQFHEYKTHLIYTQLDLLKILSPHAPPSIEQIQSIRQSYLAHTSVEIPFQTIQSYVQNLFNAQ